LTTDKLHQAPYSSFAIYIIIIKQTDIIFKRRFYGVFDYKGKGKVIKEKEVNRCGTENEWLLHH